MRREIILELIKKIPGITYNEIVRKTGLSNGVISHYLIKLLDNKEIEKEGTKRGKYFVKKIPKNDRALITLLRNKTNNDIFKILMKNSNDVLSVTKIKTIVKKSDSTISVSLKILQKNGVIERMIMNKSTKLTNDIGYRIYNKKLWNTFIIKYNL